MIHFSSAAKIPIDGSMEEKANMERNWEEGKKGPRQAYRVGHYVTITPKGVIFINRFTSEALREPVAVKVLFDRINQTIGIRRAHPREENAFVAKTAPRGAKRIRAAHAINQFGVYTTETIRFLNPEVNEKGTLLLDLRNVVTATNGRKGEKLRRKDK